MATRMALADRAGTLWTSPALVDGLLAYAGSDGGRSGGSSPAQSAVNPGLGWRTFSLSALV